MEAQESVEQRPPLLARNSDPVGVGTRHRDDEVVDTGTTEQIGNQSQIRRAHGTRRRRIGDTAQHCGPVRVHPSMRDPVGDDRSTDPPAPGGGDDGGQVSAPGPPESQYPIELTRAIERDDQLVLH